MTAAFFIELRQTILETQQNIFASVCCAAKDCGSRFVFLFGLTFLISPYSVHAEEDQWRLCAAPTKTAQTKTTTLKNDLAEGSDTSASKEMTFTADKFEVHGSQYRLTGKVDFVVGPEVVGIILLGWLSYIVGKIDPISKISPFCLLIIRFSISEKDLCNNSRISEIFFSLTTTG